MVNVSYFRACYVIALEGLLKVTTNTIIRKFKFFGNSFGKFLSIFRIHRNKIVLNSLLNFNII